MALTNPIKHGDWNSVRQAIQQLSHLRLGPDSSPTFASVTLSGLTNNSLLYASNGVITSLGVATNGQLPIGSTGSAPVLATLTGTANQITVTNGAGTITLSLPQDIHTGASPTFVGLTLSGFTQGSIIFAGASGVLSEDNTNLYWDDTNDRLGVCDNTPITEVDVGGAVRATRLLIGGVLP